MKKTVFIILPFLLCGCIIKKYKKEVTSEKERSSISNHEIRSYLNVLQGLTSLLEDTSITCEQRKIISEINKISQVLSSQTECKADDCLSGREEEFSLNAYLHTLSDTYSALSARQRLSWKTDIKIPDNMYVIADRLKLNHLFNNILSNALKYTLNGSISLVAEITGETSCSAAVRFAVIDTGIGIPYHIQSIIFDKYVRGENHHDSHGSGLGLPICKKIVEEMGGEIAVSSSEGVGTTFTFSIVFTKTSCLPDTHRTSVLIVDDDPLCYEIIRSYLPENRYSCIYASSGDEAVSLCMKKEYDIILTDVCMSGKDGIQTARILKEEIGVISPVIAVTGEEISSPYFDDVVLKPLNRVSFVPIIDMHRSISQKTRAISKLGGREDLYIKYKDRFFESNKDASRRICTLINVGNFREAYIIAHNIKGMASTLGLDEIFSISASLCEDLKGHCLSGSSLTERLDKAINSLAEKKDAMVK